MVANDAEKAKNVSYFVHQKMERLPRIEEKLDSNSQKITYLVKRINQLHKAQGGRSSNAMTKDRLIAISDKLRKVGLLVEYSDGRGYIKLKAIDSKGLEMIKRLNTIFPISMLESFFENIVQL